MTELLALLFNDDIDDDNIDDDNDDDRVIHFSSFPNHIKRVRQSPSSMATNFLVS